MRLPFRLAATARQASWLDIGAPIAVTARLFRRGPAVTEERLSHVVRSHPARNRGRGQCRPVALLNFGFAHSANHTPHQNTVMSNTNLRPSSAAPGPHKRVAPECSSGAIPRPPRRRT